MTAPLRVVVVDDQDLVRLGLRTLLDHEPGLTLVGEASDGLGAVREVTRLRPDVVLMDIRMPGVDGIEATRRICADPDLGATRVVVLTTFAHDDYVLEALHAGASGFLLKDTSPAEIVAAIRTVTDGAALLSPQVTRTVIRSLLHGRRAVRTPHPRLADLTPREREVVVLVAQGLSNTEIAERLVLSPATARTHVSRSMLKLGARDRAQLVVFAYQSGLLD